MTMPIEKAKALIIDHLIKLTIWHDDGMIEDESSGKEKTNG